MKKQSNLFKLLFLFLALFSFLNINAQEMTVTGVVTDASDGMPLPGVTVAVKGTTTGTITTPDGAYTLKVSKGQTLVFSFIGYKNVETIIESQSQINIALEEDVIGMDEVVVIGYGTVKKDDATGSVVAISSKDFNKGNITSPQDLLVGKASGVSITSSGGAPGSGSTIRIRGGSSLNASNDPLIIIDGVPISNDNVSGSSNILSFINPNDIETFNVLKDASATAIYGSRASNGVIIITTKQGKKGQNLKFSYSGNVAVSTPINYIDVYSGDEFRQIAWDKRELFDEEVYNLLGSANTDWQKEIFRTAISTDHNVSASGAFKNLPYRVSIGYTDQQGILENTDMQRFTGSLNLNPSFFNNSLKLNANAKIMSTKHNFGDEGAIGSAINMDPTQSIKDGNADTDGYFQWPTYGANLGTPNPVEQAMAVDNKSDILRFVGNVQFTYELPFLSGLKANLNLATDYADGTGHNNRPVTSPSTLTTPFTGKLNTYNSTVKNNLLDFYLGYNKILNENHRLDATAGYSWQHFEREGDSYTEGIADNVAPVTDSYITENYLVSFFGRANYTLKERYLLTGTVRYDGSSRFANNPWGLFPSAAFAWKIKEESFLQDVDFISDMKLRLGWGVTGQQDIGSDYPAQALYREAREGAYYMINGQWLPTLRPDSYDPDIKWEETTTQNIALDFGFMNNRLRGSVDLYKRVTEDLLNEVTIPSGSNFSNTLLTNVGSLENRGVEVSLDWVAISTPDMSLNIGANFTYNKNEITKLLLTDDPDYIGILYGDAFTGQKQVTRVGDAAYSYFVNKQVYDTNGNPIEGMYVDISGNGGTVNGDNEDKYLYHNPAPDYLLGFSFRFNYKDFDLSASTRANIGNYVYNQVAAGASYDQMQQIGYWKNMPKYLSETQFVKRQFTSDYFVENASFFKVDNISAGYNFKALQDKLDLRLSFTVQNLLTITNYSGLDPEVNGGIDNNFYPRPRTFTLGLNMNF
ncbi:SusC/RagA family TonB-linked outer membrane protein [Carboxylicivirga caseinilyticus]|uniref:SusC/RagA family TonB-linked outer membrane protein n=1 Tax=Carboxylicivirga caseinilyticus TaxID=3417572 RepID=UPI003D350483|nr:TonB-dependent receptor [Marinilabiliaceae bacterium A049]